jgi:hypothetical protein
VTRFVPTTVRLDGEDVRALKRARADGIRKRLTGSCIALIFAAAAPSTLLFESRNRKLGDESELFRDIED